MFARRAIFAVLFSVTMAGSLWLAALALAPGGFGILDMAALLLFAVTLPWMVAGFCNAVIGFVIMRFSADPVAAVMPAAGLIRGDEPVTASTAILLCIRNELPIRIIRNLEPMLEGIHASGYGERFHLYLLSDTSDADLAVREEAHFSELIARWRDRVAISYRRRTVNIGFKAGNIREFCESWGSRHEFAVTLDADSFMPADAIHPPRSDHAGRSQAWHPSGPDRWIAVDEPVRPHLSVRHAARHALLHDRKRVVAVRLRSLLGAQRRLAARTVHQALPSSDVVRRRRGRAAYPQSRPDRSGADAALPATTCA